MYSWEVEELSSCADNMEPYYIRELVETLRNDPLYVADAVAEKLDDKLQRVTEERGLCPNCFAVLEYDGDVGSLYETDSPVCQACATRIICPECSYWRDA